MRYLRRQLAFTLALLLVSDPLIANTNKDIYRMDLEQLMQIEVISAEKKSQSLLRTAAAVHVITQDDIRRSGALSLPEVLRGVPGLEVMQIDASNWAVSIRGFDSRFANKLLVMIDGRTIYTPLFSGVYWNMNETLLDDIDRIEVIRGPGGTMWGANAVNGVINIITKKTSETQGTQFSFTGGSQERNISARHGGRINDQVSYRFFTKGKHVENFNNGTPLVQANDQWRDLSSGFRVDGNLDSRNQWTLQGGYNVGHANQLGSIPSLIPLGNFITPDTVKYHAGNILFRWDKQQSDDNKWRIQAYYDYFRRDAYNAALNVHTFDLEIQNQLKLSMLSKHQFVWGAGYRGIVDELESSFALSFNPGQRYTRTFNAFIQDEIQLTDKLRWTLGSKVEHNSYTGFEFQPNTRMLWEINDKHSVWGSLSRAVRVPSRTESDARINFLATPGRDPLSPPALFSIFGNPNLHSEKVYSAELGYRSILTSTLTVDTSLFYNYYDYLSSSAMSFSGIELSPVLPHLLMATNLGNQMTATTYGAELHTKWQATDYWQLMASYTWFKLDGQYKNGSMASLDRLYALEHSDPRNQFSLRSDLRLPHNLEFNSMLYYTDKLQGQQVNDQARVDLRLAWAPKPMLELSVVGQNILNEQHKEFTAVDLLYSQIPRSVYGRIILRF